MKKVYFSFIILLFVVAGLVSPKLFAKAEDLATQCAAVSQDNGCSNLTSTDCKALLQKCSDYYDQESAKLAQDITKTAEQKNTLAAQITGLKGKIRSLEAQISQGTIKVKGLNLQIEDTKSSIDKTSQDILDSQNQIATIIKNIYQEDKKSSVQVLLEGDLSDFFDNLAYLESLNSRVSNLLESTKDLQGYLQGQKVKMDGEVTQLQKTIALQAAQKAENEKNKQTQQQYLQLTEAQYQQQLKDKTSIEQKAAKIKALLFQVVGVTKVPTFGEALEVAKTAAALVGIRPAFLLAIISQESAIGRNTGQCLLVDPATGNGKKKTTGAPIIRIMHPTRDVPPFLKITAALGRNPYETPVSCWITDYRKGVPYGWGGAMGPAQFIPSTWNLFADRLKAVLGQPADPWGIKDSFTASGMYLADLGATAQTMATEKKAASRYYGGSSSYASSVWNRATCIQAFIDNSGMSTYCQNLIF
jgi:peptidoglycan hydrolase CwlO-like protein